MNIVENILIADIIWRMNSVVVVTLADGRHLNAAKQLFVSFYLNGGVKADYLLLAYNVPVNKIRDFKNKGIIVKHCKGLVKTTDKKNLVYSCKALLLHPYMKKWKQIIFLDTDILVKSSLTRLLNSNGLAAAGELDEQDIGFQFKKSLDFKIFMPALESIADKKIDISQKAFNVGVMSINTSIINPAIYKKLIKILNAGKDNFKFLEQAAFNILFYANWQKIPRIFNFQPLHYMDKYRIGKNGIVAAILHFAGSTKFNKPWNKKNPFYPEWRKNLKLWPKINFLTDNTKSGGFSGLEIFLLEKYYAFRRLVVNRKLI